MCGHVRDRIAVADLAGSVLGRAQPRVLLDDVPGSICEGHWLMVAAIVADAFPEGHAKQGKDHEEEDAEAENAAEVGQRGKERADEDLHGWHGVERAEWPEDPEGA